MPDLLPWQASQWSRMQSHIRNHTLPHALLMSGSPGLGKLEFARTLTQALLCTALEPTGLGCNQCRSCRLFLADSHPDFYTVRREEDSHQIKIDQVRALTKFMVLSRQMARYRVALICDAEALNPNAANSLLKTLEEPPAQSLIIVVTSKPTLIPATLTSRCQRLMFAPPPKTHAMTWLQGQVSKHDAELLLSLAYGAPLKARHLAETNVLEKRTTMFHDFVQTVEGKLSVLELVHRCNELNLAEIIEWIHSWLIDAVRLKFQMDTISLVNPDLCPDMRGLCERVDLRCLFKLQDEVLSLKRSLGTSVNRQLMLEDVLLATMEAFRPLSKET